MLEWYFWLTIGLSIVGAVWGVKKHIANLMKESEERSSSHNERGGRCR